MRRYYLHTRNNGTFYAELVDPQTGIKLTARSTGTKNRGVLTPLEAQALFAMRWKEKRAYTPLSWLLLPAFVVIP